MANSLWFTLTSWNTVLRILRSSPGVQQKLVLFSVSNVYLEHRNRVTAPALESYGTQISWFPAQGFFLPHVAHRGLVRRSAGIQIQVGNAQCGRQKIALQKISIPLSLDSVTVTLYGKRVCAGGWGGMGGVFTDVIKLRILRWGEYSGLCDWALKTFICTLIRGRQKEISYTQRRRRC